MGQTKQRKDGGTGVTKKPPTKYKSGFEAKGAAYLESLGVPVLYETQKIRYVVPEKSRNYIPDFTLPNGIVCEFKGKLDRDVREKMALVIEQNPDKDIRFLFMRDNKMTKTSKMRYSGWCEKRGIKYAVSEHGHVPQEWIAEPSPPSSLDPGSKPRARKSVGGSVPAKPSLDSSTRIPRFDGEVE